MFKVTVNNGWEKYFTKTVETLGEAAHLKKAWEVNQPWLLGSVVVFDADDYLVPGSMLKTGLAIRRNDITDQLRILNA